MTIEPIHKSVEEPRSLWPIWYFAVLAGIVGGVTMMCIASSCATAKLREHDLTARATQRALETGDEPGLGPTNFVPTSRSTYLNPGLGSRPILVEAHVIPPPPTLIGCGAGTKLTKGSTNFAGEFTVDNFTGWFTVDLTVDHILRSAISARLEALARLQGPGPDGTFVIDGDVTVLDSGSCNVIWAIPYQKKPRCLVMLRNRTTRGVGYIEMPRILSIQNLRSGDVVDYVCVAQ